MPMHTGDRKVNDTTVSVAPDVQTLAENELVETRPVSDVPDCEYDEFSPKCWRVDDGFSNVDIHINGDINIYIDNTTEPVYLLPPEGTPDFMPAREAI